jgi:hypothetical protein
MDRRSLQDDAMQHIQHLTTTWFHKPTARAGEPPAPPTELPDRERVRRLAELFHRQLMDAKRRSGTHYHVLQQQTEALRQFTLELTPEQANEFMNMYTEESSAVEREWESKKGSYNANQPLSPMLVRVLIFAVTVFAIVLAIKYAV